MQVFILPRERDLRDLLRLVRPVPSIQGWGLFLTRFDVRSLNEVEPAFQLIRQSYESALNGHRSKWNYHPARRKQIV